MIYKKNGSMYKREFSYKSLLIKKIYTICNMFANIFYDQNIIAINMQFSCSLGEKRDFANQE